MPNRHNPIPGQVPMDEDVQHPSHPFLDRWSTRFRLAKLVPEDRHEYVVARDLPPDGQADYDSFVRHIRRHGIRRAWRWSPEHRPTTYSYLRVGDYEYWEAPMGLVNRKDVTRLSDEERARRSAG